VKSHTVDELIEITMDLTEVFELLTLMKDENTKDGIVLQVKGRLKDEHVLFPLIKRCHEVIDDIDSEGKIFGSLHDEMNECVDYLNKNYSIKSKWLGVPEDLREEDFQTVYGYLDRILRILLEKCEKLKITLTNNEEKIKIPKNLAKGMDKKTKSDLKEAQKAFEVGVTTGSYMLISRVAEQLGCLYYEKILKNSSKDKTWHEMLLVIKNEHAPKRQNRIINLFGFLKDCRNEAQHPGKQFNKKDCETLLRYIDDFKKESSKY